MHCLLQIAWKGILDLTAAAGNRRGAPIFQRVAFALLLAFRGWAQSPASVAPANAVKDPRTLSEKLALFDLTADPQELANVYRHHLPALVYYALPPETVSAAYGIFLSRVNATRVDQQLGATGANDVAKAGLTTLASLALESGVLTETTTQNVATLHANADGLMRFLTNREVVPLCASNDAGCQPGWAKDVDLSASFSANRFESATVSYAIANPRDIRSPEYRAKWLAWFEANHAALGAGGQDLLAYVANLIAPGYPPESDNASGGKTGGGKTAGGGTAGVNPGENLSRYDAWRKDAEAAITAVPATAAERAAIFAAQLDRLIGLMREIDPQFDAKLADLESTCVRYFATRLAPGSNPVTSLITSLVTKPQWLVQATYSEPRLEPKLINARLVYAQSPRGVSSTTFPNTSPNIAGNPGTFTANIGVDLYQNTPPVDSAPSTVQNIQSAALNIAEGLAQSGIQNQAQRVSRFRDAQAAIEFDRAFNGTGPPAAFSIGAFYQYQPRPAILLDPSGAETWANVRGSLVLIQAGLTLTIAGSGLKIPIGVSWSNRTDVARGQEVRAHFGFTFDSGALVLSK
jgi:hypothetical protein